MFKLCRKGDSVRLRTEAQTDNSYGTKQIIITDSYETKDNTNDYELENRFLRKEIASIHKDIIHKQEYIKFMEIQYRKDLNYTKILLSNEYNKIINDLYKENNEYSNEILKLNNKILYLEREIKKQYSQMKQVDNFICNICLDNFKNILLEPCNHLCCCDNCYYNSSITECPLCRKDILATRKVFL